MMKSRKAKTILEVARSCIHGAEIMIGVRMAVRYLAPVYEANVDGALSNLLELLSGLMDEFTLSCTGFRNEFVDFGDEPISHADASEQLATFVAHVNAIFGEHVGFPSESLVSFPAHAIGVRALTFSLLLKQDTGQSDQ